MKFAFNIEDIKYAKILYRNKDASYSNTRVGIKRFDEREILACSKFEDGLDINVPQEVSLSIICNDGIYKTKTTLKNVSNEEPYAFFTLATPLGIEYEQNREYFRVNAQYKCKYKLVNDDAVEEYEAYTVDISANGISIVLPQHKISENSAGLIIDINNRIIETKVRYVRSERINNGYKISFTYTKISENDRDYISQTCIQKQIEARRSSLK